MIPLPKNTDSITERFQAWEHSKNHGRRLEAARVGGGGLTIKNSGSMTIGSGGNLFIVDGDLEIADGTIPANALKSHIGTTGEDVSKEKFTVGAYNQWRTTLTLTITPPSWATSGICYAMSDVRIGVKRMTIGYAPNAITGRIKIGNAMSVEVPGSWDEPTQHSISILTAVIDAQPITIEGQINLFKGSGYSDWETPAHNKATLNASVIWKRDVT